MAQTTLRPVRELPKGQRQTTHESLRERYTKTVRSANLASEIASDAALLRLKVEVPFFDFSLANHWATFARSTASLATPFGFCRATGHEMPRSRLHGKTRKHNRGRKRCNLRTEGLGIREWGVGIRERDQCNVGMWEYENEKMRKWGNGEMAEMSRSRKSKSNSGVANTVRNRGLLPERPTLSKNLCASLCPLCGKTVWWHWSRMVDTGEQC